MLLFLEKWQWCLHLDIVLPFFSDTISCHHNFGRYTRLLFKPFFMTNASVIATQRSFPAHFLLRRNYSLSERTSTLLCVSKSQGHGSSLKEIHLDDLQALRGVQWRNLVYKVLIFIEELIHSVPLISGLYVKILRIFLETKQILGSRICYGATEHTSRISMEAL